MVEGRDESEGLREMRIILLGGGDLEGLFGGDESGALLVEEVGLNSLGVGVGGMEGGALRGLHYHNCCRIIIMTA